MKKLNFQTKIRETKTISALFPSTGGGGGGGGLLKFDIMVCKAAVVTYLGVFLKIWKITNS